MWLVALRVGLAHDVHREINRAHDAVAKLVMDELLDGGAVHVDNFISAVDQWVGGHRSGKRAFVGHHLQPLLLFRVQAKNFANDLGLLGIQHHLAQAGGGGPFFAQAHFLGHRFPGDAFADLAGDDFFGDVVAVHKSFLGLDLFHLFLGKNRAQLNNQEKYGKHN